MEYFILPILVVGMIFIGLPWVVMHYLTQWKTAPTITNDDEALLEELYQLAKRLEERMETVERLVESDGSGFAPRKLSAADTAPQSAPEPDPIAELESLIAAKKAEREGAKL